MAGAADVGATERGARTLTDLIDRETHLRALRSAIEDARAGRSSIVLLEGHAGTGKTALLDAFAVGAGEVPVLVARCGRAEQSVALGVARQILESAPDGVDAESTAIFTQAGRPYAQRPTVEALHALYLSLRALATKYGPLAVVVDDTDLADVSSLQWLGYVARRMHGLPLVLVLAARSRRFGPHEAALAELAAHPAATRLVLGPLGTPAVRTLAQRVLGTQIPDTFARACLDAAAGNPQLVAELIARLHQEGWPGEGRSTHSRRGLGTPEPMAALDRVTVAVGRVKEVFPQVLTDVAVARLWRESAELSAVAEALAVLNEAADPDLVTELSGVAPIEQEHAIGVLRDIGVLAPSGRGFPHPLLRDAVLARKSASFCTGIHQRAARALHRHGAPPVAVAVHLLRTSPVGESWAADALLHAGQQRIAQDAHEEAARLLRRALREPLDDERRLDGLVSLAIAHLHAGRAGVTDRLDEAVESARDARERGAVASRLAYALHTDDHGCMVATFLRRTADELRDVAGQDVRDLRLHLEAQVVFHAQYCREAVSAARAVAEAWQRQDDLAGRTTGEQQALAALSLYRAATLDVPAATVAESVELLMAAGIEPTLGTSALFLMGVDTLVLADRDENAGRLLAWCAALKCAHSGLVPGLLAHTRAGLLLRSGQVPVAVTEAGEAVARLVVADRQGLFLPLAAARLAECLLESGRPDEAAEALDRATNAPAAQRAWGWAAVLTVRGRLRAADGDLLGAVADARAAGRHAAGWPLRNPMLLPWRSVAADAYGALGERDEAVSIAQAELDLARESGAPSAVGTALRTLGAAIGGVAGIALLEESASLLAESPARLEYVRTLAALGRALESAGQREQARERLRAGLDLAQEYGAGLLMDRLYGELMTTGARPRRARRTGTTALTAAEHRIASLAAGGSSNRDIADRLYVTQRAVEKSLTSVYRKLAIAGRLQLATALSRGPQRTADTGPAA